MSYGKRKESLSRPSGASAPHSPRRLFIPRWQSGSRSLEIRATLSSVRHAQALYDRYNRSRRSLSNELLASLEKLSGVKVVPRNRTGYLQPQVPKLLSDQFQALARQSGFRGGSSFLKNYVSRWISPETGNRRRRRSFGPFKRPHDSQGFIKKGQELVSSARRGENGETLVRYAFDAGLLKKGIIDLARKMTMSLSEFISAAMYRAISTSE